MQEDKIAARTYNDRSLLTIAALVGVSWEFAQPVKMLFGPGERGVNRSHSVPMNKVRAVHPLH